MPSKKTIFELENIWKIILLEKKYKQQANTWKHVQHSQKN